MATLNGYQGQIRAIDQQAGYFLADQEIMDLIALQCNNYYAGFISRLGIQAPEKSVFLINGEAIEMGKTGMYEINNVIINSLLFEENSSSDVVIDYII